MFKNTALVFCGFLIFVVDTAMATSCGRPDAERVTQDYDTIFVAFLTEGVFVEADDPEGCGWLEGYFKVVEELKGNPSSVSVVRKKLTNCNGRKLSSSSDRLPIGKYILVTANSDIARFSSCGTVWDDYGSNCLVDAIQRRLNIDARNADMRDWCIKNEESGGELERIKGLRAYVSQLEREREDIDRELEELKEVLAEADTPEQP